MCDHKPERARSLHFRLWVMIGPEAKCSGMQNRESCVNESQATSLVCLQIVFLGFFATPFLQACWKASLAMDSALANDPNKQQRELERSMSSTTGSGNTDNCKWTRISKDHMVGIGPGRLPRGSPECPHIQGQAVDLTMISSDT